MENPTNSSGNLLSWIYNFIPNLIKSLLVYLLFYCSATFIYDYMSTQKISTYEEELRKKKIKLSLFQIKDILYYILMGIGIIISIKQLGFESATFVTVIGTVGLAIGLAIQGTITSMTSGLYLSTMNIFSIGDEITIIIPVSKQFYKGIVTNFNLFYSTIFTREGQFLTIPNNLIQTGIISNERVL